MPIRCLWMREATGLVRGAAAWLSILAVLSSIGCKSERDPARGAEGSARVEAIDAVEGDRAIEEHTNFVTGSVKGVRFAESVTSIAVAGDGAADRTIVYLFSRAMTCMDLSFTGWDERIAEGTVVLALELRKPRRGDLVVVPADAQAAGEASARLTRSSRAKGGGKEADAERGTVTLRALPVDGSVAGRFAIWFGQDRLSGDFSATFCPAGHEP
jgi:hypothetical protein